MSDHLSESERRVLLTHRDGTPGPHTRRAEIVLLKAEGATTAEIAAAVQLSTVQVRHWLREWNVRRLEIFPAGDEAAPPAAAPKPVKKTVRRKKAPAKIARPKAISVEAAIAATSPAEAAPAPAVPPELPQIPGVDVPRLPLALNINVGLLPDDPMAEAGRKVMLFHMERMLLNEPGSRLGEDIEAVHDMRVSTRRIRSAIRLFDPFFKSGKLARHSRHLKRVAATLGQVRDLEVQMDKAARYLDAHPGEGLDPLFARWHADVDAARADLIDELDSKKFARFVKHFYAFLTTPGKGARALPEPGQTGVYQVRHVAPRLIYEHYERVRAYEAVLDDPPLTTLHALRIEFKRLRYAVEFFEEVLGPEARVVINAIKRMQDHLGDLNDTCVVSDMLRDFVDAHNNEYSGVPIFMRPDMSGVIHYAAAQRAEQQHLLDTFPEAWNAFMSEDVRRNLALAVAAL